MWLLPVAAHALPMFRERRQTSTRKQEEKARKDPVKSHRPDLPVHGPGTFVSFLLALFRFGLKCLDFQQLPKVPFWLIEKLTRLRCIITRIFVFSYRLWWSVGCQRCHVVPVCGPTNCQEDPGRERPGPARRHPQTRAGRS